ncbi:MAG: hypothetical protein Q8K55_10970 [Gemmatimonadaceae bacterium]|nr:hypothetical protein [Gemmatimonadaceae bacterium]
MPDALSTLASLALAGSLAVERLVTIIKTFFPSLNEVGRPAWGESDERADQDRRLRVLFVTIIASQLTAFFLATGDGGLSGAVKVSSELGVPWPLFGLLISGGSAFWTSVVAYASALKDVQKSEAKRVEQNEQRGQSGFGAPAQPPASVVTVL